MFGDGKMFSNPFKELKLKITTSIYTCRLLSHHKIWTGLLLIDKHVDYILTSLSRKQIESVLSNHLEDDANCGVSNRLA